MSSALDRLKNLTSKISSYELSRKENMRDLKNLFDELQVSEKVDNFEDIFHFKAINLSGISLSDENLGEIKEGKYLQIIAIKYDNSLKVKNKNISLAYYGRVEKVDAKLRKKVISFVLKWRFEKSFMTLEHYNNMISKL
ncbi:MAG: hypothetical protein U9N42_10065 [Campylobacterota bacterium]|nr:hypothetical protein [Campylobacterota bacterium]